MIISTDTGPRKGDGWEEFLEDEDSVWYDAFETKMEDGDEVLDVDAYDEFGNIQELVNFVAGTGTYEDTNSFMPSEADLEDRKLAMKQAASPQCPECLDDLDEYLQQGAMRSEVDIDPYMDVNVWVTEEEAQFSDEHDVRYTGHAMAYCEDHKEESFLLYEESWFDEEPEEL